MRWNKKPSTKSDKTETVRTPKRGVVGYSRKSALLEEAITQMNAGKYGRSSAALKELLALDPVNMEARRLFATLHLRLGSLIPAREAFDALIAEALQRQDYWLTESLLREYLAAGPRCVPYLEKLGMIYQEKGNALEAVEEYGKAVDILIEDPDPERPGHAGQLYAKIRELAPASPVAFRLSSFFDPETGELLQRQSSAAESTATVPQDVLGENSSEQISSRADSAMPWEIQSQSDGLEPSLEISHPLEIAQPTLQPENSAVVLPSAPFPDQALVASGEGVGDRTHAIGSEAQTDGLRAVSTHDIGEDLVGGEIKQFGKQEPVKDSPPSTNSVDSTAEISLLPLDASPGVAVADSPIAFQESDQGSPEAQVTPSILEDCAVPVAMGLNTEQTAEASITLTEEFPKPSLPTPLQFEEEPSPLSLKTEPPSSESLPAPTQEDVSFNTDEVENIRTEESVAPTDSPIVPAQISADDIAQPWKQPGFSWKSLFDTAWKLGEPSSGKETPTSPVPTPESEIVAETSPAQHSQVRLGEGTDRGTLKREGESQHGNEETVKSPIEPMPWDQVQESVLPIPPTETNASSVEVIAPLVDQPQDRDSTARDGDSQQPSSRSINGSDPEPAPFSFVQDAPTVPLEERHNSVVEMIAPSPTADSTDQVTESEPAFSFVRSSQVDETIAPVSQTLAVQASIHDAGLDALADQKEDRPEPDEVATDREQVRGDAVPEENDKSPQPEFQTHPSLPVAEVPREKIERIHFLQSAPIERSETEYLVEKNWVSSENRRDASALPHDEVSPEVAHVQARSPVSEPVPPQHTRMEIDVSTRVSGAPTAASGISALPESPEQEEVSRPLPEVSVGSEALVDSPGIRRAPETRIRVEEAKQTQKSTGMLKGVGAAVTGLLRTGFSTTHAIVTTVIGVGALVGICIVLGIGGLALTWMIMEEPPSPTFQSFTTTPQQTLSGSQKNGYTLLVGMDAPVGQDPFRTGVERQSAIGDSTTALDCFGTPGTEAGGRSSASTGAMRGWVRGSDPIGQFKSQQQTIQGWSSQQQVVLERYRQWQKLPFEDWGYGRPVSLPCGAMVFAHQLHVADGFVQGADMGVERLETDMEMWRVVLSQARTLPVKMLALQAINDDIALASGLLIRSDFETKHLGRIAKFVRPLDQGELSLRWPMQSELVSAEKTYESRLQAARAEGQAISAMVASALPLPKQRRLNDYAKYYEVSYQATGEKQYGSLPKWKDHVRFPAAGVMDYLINPIENVVGVDPLPQWDVYNGLIIDTDAHLRLASLQAWLRRGSSEGDLLNKIAKAGQNFYDPYTGLPMLVNQKKGLLYSVGHDGKDQDADPQADVVVEIPFASTSANQDKSSASSSKSR